MHPLIKLALKYNKASKQFVTSIPKKQLSAEMRGKLSNIKNLKVRIEGFDKW